MVERLAASANGRSRALEGLWRSMASASGVYEAAATVVLRSRALAAFPAALREKVAAGALLV